MPRLLAVLLAAVPLVAAAQDSASATPPRVEAPSAARVQLGVGIGSAMVDGHGGSALRIRVGGQRSERLSFAFEGGYAETQNALVGTYDVAATVFPWKRYFFVRGGVGLTTLDQWDSAPRRGANALLGIGVALGRASGFDLTLNVEAILHRTAAPGGNQAHGYLSDTTLLWLGTEWR